jgi:hypothetical protein
VTEFVHAYVDRTTRYKTTASNRVRDASLVRVRVASTKTTPALSRVTRVALPTEPGRGHGESQHSRSSSLCLGPAAT